eukprot:102883-Chlamydomonas_euryale.AAC.1
MQHAARGARREWGLVHKDEDSTEGGRQNVAPARMRVHRSTRAPVRPSAHPSIQCCIKFSYGAA